MIRPEIFYDTLIRQNVKFFTGVPDSLLKEVCSYITNNTPNARNIIAVNEGSALSIGAGYHLATQNIPLIYMQNSGLGNIVNPLLSLADEEVYKIELTSFTEGIQTKVIRSTKEQLKELSDVEKKIEKVLLSDSKLNQLLLTRMLNKEINNDKD